MITLRFKGTVVVEETGAPLPGLFVKAYDEDLLFDDLLGTASTDTEGTFEIVSEPEDFRELFERKPDLYFKVFRADRKTLVQSTERDVRRNAADKARVHIAIPWERARDPDALRLDLLGDGDGPKASFAVGEVLRVQASGLMPLRAHEIAIGAGGKSLFECRLMADRQGRIEPTVLWPQAGLDEPRSERRYSFDEADRAWEGRDLTLTISLDRKAVLRGAFTIVPSADQPMIFAADAHGRPLNAIDSQDDPLWLALRGLPFAGAASVFVVERQHGWRVGDALVPARRRDGGDAGIDIRLPEARGARLESILPPGALPAGAYDLIIRPLRAGDEDNRALRLLPRDIVGSRYVTGLVVRETFWRAKPVLGGCVNKIPISGRTVSGAPYFHYSDAFTVGEDVWAALDPGIVDPGNIGKMCALYVIARKTEAQWNVDNSLSHLAVLGGNAAVTKLKLQAGCVNANKVKVWPAAMQPGEYDIVADFGNNTPDAMAFVPDNAYDTPLDIIDGYFVAGFRVVEDPGTMGEFTHVGAWDYDENTVTALGMSGTVSVDDENTAYAVPGAFSVLSRSVALKAHVRFPADAAGVTQPAQISVASADYPVVVVVHGNGHNYTAYDVLLHHLARNGFVAASIDNRFVNGGALVHGMHALGRANNFFRHLAVLQVAFGAHLQNNIGILGHSRGGEAVVKIPRLNQQQGLGHSIGASLALAPTDQYGREVLGGAWATPLLVLYGSRDGDISGHHPSEYGGAFTWRPTALRSSIEPVTP